METVGLDDEDNDILDGIEEIQINESLRPAQGSPFSALIPSMWPQDILLKLRQPEVNLSTIQCTLIAIENDYFRPMELMIITLMNLDFVWKKKMDPNKVQINCSANHS